MDSQSSPTRETAKPTADENLLEIVTQANFMLLPPAPGKCHLCACVHQPSSAHNAESVYYQVRFHMKHRRTGRWSDAVAHCPEEIRAMWIMELRKRNAWTEEDNAAITEGRAIAEPTTYAS